MDIDPHFAGADKAYNTFVWYFRRGSPNYTEAAKKLLAEYDFSRPFQLQDDPKQQDKLTTWIEYLGYACAVHYRYPRVVEKLQPDYDKAWKTLVDSEVLRPFETEEYVCDIVSAFQCQSEEDQAQKAVKSAEAVLLAVQKTSHDPRDSRLAPPARLQMAQSRLDAAKESLQLITRRNDLTTDFKRAARNYLIAKEDADRHSAKLRWILEQVPLVEAELRESDAAKGGPHTGRGTKRRLGHDQDDEITNDRRPEKRRRSGPNSSFSDISASSLRPTREPAKHSRRDNTAVDERPKTHSRGISKTPPLDQRVTRRSTQSRECAIPHAQASTSNHGPNRPKRAPDVHNNPGDTTRRSRRLAGDPPEFGMVRERRGALPLYDHYLQEPPASSRRSRQICHRREAARYSEG